MAWNRKDQLTWVVILMYKDNKDIYGDNVFQRQTLEMT